MSIFILVLFVITSTTRTWSKPMYAPSRQMKRIRYIQR
jgi:hypothetical protein